MYRSIVLALFVPALALSLAMGCGPSIAQHNGYREGRSKPWKKAKQLSFDAAKVAEQDSSVNYDRRRRARWYKFNLSTFSDLDIRLSSSPAGEQDVDVAFEILDSDFRVLMRADKTEDDAGEEKKSRSLYELAPGLYYAHVFVQKRTDAAEFTLKMTFKPRADGGDDGFPDSVAFIRQLAAVPPVDDAPPPIRKPRKCKGDKCRTKKPEVKSSSLRARITSITAAGNSTRIRIGAGQNRGVAVGWRGKVITKGGSSIPRGSFKVTKVTATSAFGSVRANSDSVTAAKYVRLRPP